MIIVVNLESFLNIFSHHRCSGASFFVRLLLLLLVLHPNSPSSSNSSVPAIGVVNALSLFTTLPLASEPPLCLIHESPGWLYIGKGQAIPEHGELRYNIRDEVPKHCSAVYQVFDPERVIAARGVLDVRKRDTVVFEAKLTGIYRVCLFLRCILNAGEMIPPHYQPRQVSIDVALDGFNIPHSGIDQVGFSTPSNVSVVSSMSGMSTSLKQIEAEMSYLKHRQEGFERTVQSTYMRVMYCASTIALVVVLVAAWQLQQIKQLLREKKVV